MNPRFQISAGEIIHCRRNAKHRIISLSGSSVPLIIARMARNEQMKALSKDEENPANHTNIIITVILKIYVNFLFPILFPK